MAKPIRVNGNLKYISNNNDIVDLVRDNCGDNLAEIIDEKIRLTEQNIAWAEQKRIGDFEAYEQANEDLTRCLQDISDVVESMQEYLQDTKKLDRDKMFLWLRDIEREINNCI